MNIGIFLPGTNKRIGGGFRFQSEILDALDRSYSGSGHTFTLIGLQPIIDKKFTNEHIKYYFLHHDLKNKMRDKLQELVCGIQNIFNKSKTNPGSWIDRDLKHIGIDVMLYLSPWHFLTMEIPYITVLWDLEHRKQPYYPEISQHGEWDRREGILANRLQRASFIMTGTEVGRQEINSYYQIPYERIRVNPLATPEYVNVHISNSNNKNGILSKKGIKPGYLFFPAVFWSHKNHISIVLAVKILRDKYKSAIDVIFVGNDKGNGTYIREQIAESGLENQFHILGYVDDDDLIELYTNALALVYVSQFGPDNLPPLEAFALKCPVIATKSEGSLEQLGDCALLIDTMHPESIADAVMRLSNEPELRNALICKASTLAASRTCRVYVNSMVNLLNELKVILRCWSH